MQQRECRSCLTCRDLRTGEPEEPGYVGCAWGRLPLRHDVAVDIKQVGYLLMVNRSEVNLERGCEVWRSTNQSARQPATSRTREGMRFYASQKRKELAAQSEASPLVPCPRGCGRLVHQLTKRGKMTRCCAHCRRSGGTPGSGPSRGGSL